MAMAEEPFAGRRRRGSRGPKAGHGQDDASRGASRGASQETLSAEVLSALRRIIRATDLHSKRLARQAGLTTPQTVVLQAVRDLGEVTSGALARRVHLSQGTVTTILDRLEGRGLIERYRSTSDRRVVHSRLTRQGRAVLRKAPPLLHERFLDAFDELPRKRQRQIIETLDEVAAMMGVADLDAAPLLDSDASAKRES